jgi:ribonuclease BN (tRNA processing enzyme)
VLSGDEVMYLGGLDRLLARVPNATTLREHLTASHTTTEEVGKVAAEAGAKTLVLNHFVPGDDPSIIDEMWVADVRKDFSGPVIAGRDLQRSDRCSRTRLRAVGRWFGREHWATPVCRPERPARRF